jgi:predicted AAA+ superfamily ATPase
MDAKLLTISLFQTFIHLSSKYKKKYCYPSQEKILELLGKYHNIDISRRSLNRWLLYLENQGYFKRVRRITPDGEGSFKYKSTLYVLGNKMFRMAKAFMKIVYVGPYWKDLEKKRRGDPGDEEPARRQSDDEFKAGLAGFKAAVKGG